MDLLNQIGKQLSELFESMTPGARVTAGLLLAVVVVSLGYLFQQSNAGPDEYLFGAEPLSSSEINAMTAAMSQAGLNDFEVQGAHIRVPRGTRHEYIGAVANAGAMPTHAKDFMLKALDSGSAFESRAARQQRIKLAVEQEYSHIIGWFPWVQQASVIYDQKSIAGPRRVDLASATVSVMPKPGELVTSRRQRRIQTLVAGGFTSMSPDNVTVNDLGGESSIADTSGQPDPEEFDTPYHRERVRVENEIRTEIIGQLSDIPGVRVQVNAILDEMIQQSSTERKPDPQAVASEETTDSQSTTEKTVDNGNRPGGFAQGPRGVGRGDDSPRREQTVNVTNDRTVTSSVVGESITQSVRAGMKANEIQASVAVPRDYVVQVWKQQQLALTGEVPEQIDAAAMQRAEDNVINTVKNVVKPLLPKLLREDDYQQVNVTIIDTLTPKPLPEPSVANTALAWATRNGTTIAMVGMAVFSLFMLRSVVKSTGGDGDASDSPVLRFDDDGLAAAAPGDASDEEEEEGRPKLKLKKAETLKDDLSEMVRDDPDAAAAILRSWIGNAS